MSGSGDHDQIKCDQVELYKSDTEDRRSLFYSAPLNCQSENQTVLEAHFDLRKVGLNNIHPAVTSIMACASILKNDTIKGLQLQVLELIYVFDLTNCFHTTFRVRRTGELHSC